MINPFTHLEVLRKGRAERRAALAAQGPVGPADVEAIQNPFAAAGMAGGFGAFGPDAPPDAIAQIERLDALRRSGTLTQEEFDARKRRLLGG